MYNQAYFLVYREVLQQDVGWLDDIERSKRSKRLPVVFTRVEAKKDTPEAGRHKMAYGKSSLWIGASFDGVR